MKPKKLKKLLASLSDVPLGCYTSSADHVGWQGLTTKDADAIRNALAEKIRRKERKKAGGRCLAASLAALRWVQAGFADGGCSCALEDSVDDVDHDDYREHDSYCAEYVDGYIDDQLEKITGQAVPRSDWASTPDVCIGVEGYVDSVGAFNKENGAQYFERVYGKALSDIADYLRMPGVPTLSADVPNAVRGMVKQADLDRVSLANCREALNDIAAYLDMPAGSTLHADVPNAVAGMVAQVKIDRDDVARNTVKTELDAVVALQECAAHIGMNDSVESVPFILDNLPRIVKDLVASSRWPTRAGGWEDCSGLDAELTIAGPSGSNPRHFRRLRPECSPRISDIGGFYRITWEKNGDTLGIEVQNPGPMQKLCPDDGTWAFEKNTDPSPESPLDVANRLESVAVGLRRGEVQEDILDTLLDDAAEAIRKAVQS